MTPMTQPLFNALWSTANALGHPLFIPIYGFFLVQSRNSWAAVQWINFSAITILLVVMPLLIYPILKRSGRVNSLRLKEVKERPWPLGINVLLLCLLLIVSAETGPIEPWIQLEPSLFHFFIGATISVMLAFAMSLLKHKTSLHLMGCGGLASFALILNHSVTEIPYWQQPYPELLIVALAGILWVALARYCTKAHSAMELLSGLIVGAAPQWLIFFS